MPTVISGDRVSWTQGVKKKKDMPALENVTAVWWELRCLSKRETLNPDTNWAGKSELGDR